MTMVVTTSAKVWAVCTSVLYIKFLAVIHTQGMKTFAAGGRPPEDAKLSIAKNFKGVTQNYGLAQPDEEDVKLTQAKLVEQRWRRIVANDVESIPLGLLVFAAGVLTDANEAALVTAMIAFTMMRCLHSYAYAREKQPHRVIAWAAGHLAVMLGVVNVIVSAVFTH
jgi:glutathione S-transferase